LDYFDDDLLVIVDESHVTSGQIAAASAGDRARKEHLIEHGFRLPSAADNRPLTMEEFLGQVPQVVWVSATPGEFELERSDEIVELLVRPTGLLEPMVEVCPADGQVADVVERCQAVVAAGWRVLVTALTKRNAEDLAQYLAGAGIRARYMTGDVETLERVALMRDLRLGEYDVLVGVNLLREGLDVPEVALVAVLDADKEGFLRSTTSLIQTMGRAARNRDGHVVLYANETTASMRAAIDEVARRRAVQVAHNEATGTAPAGVVKDVGDLLADMGLSRGLDGAGGTVRGGVAGGRDEMAGDGDGSFERTVVELEAEMFAAADELRFEDAARLRDRIRELRGGQRRGPSRS
jgi:excinuclease ABC subunit B